MMKTVQLGYMARVISLYFGLSVFAYAHAGSLPQDARLVVTGGTLTDVVFALGAEARVVAVDSSSLSPARAQQKPVVGYYRELAAEGVLSVQPTHVWALAGTGSNQTLRQIERAGVQVEHFAKPESVADLLQLITDVSDRLNASEQGHALRAEIEHQLERFNARQPPADSTPRGLFILQASERGVVTAGTDTVPDLLFGYAHVDNLVAHQGYKAVSREYLALHQADFLMAPQHVVDAAGGPEAFCAQSTLRLVTAAQECRLLVMDSLLALGMTTQVATAIQQVIQYAYQHDV
ncbi:MAG: ABC transporter substrate-binding protein [Firmicutes bacterium]|nr:ABC transporter substrate-binding protein [Bacillota bacterium]